MIKLFILSVVIFLGIYPLTYVRKNIILENEIFGIFLGNYIFFSHYLLMIVFVLLLVNYIVVKIPKRSIGWILFTSLIIIGVVGYYNYRNAKVVYTKIQLDKKANRENLRVAFISDLHLTTTSNKNLFVDMVEKINVQNPDIVIFGGDILQNSHTALKDDYKEVFSKIESKYGVFTILGNHEYYGNDVEENIKYFRTLGIRVIRDEVLKIDGINIVGRDDVRRDYTVGERKSLKEIYSNYFVSLNEPIMVVDHNPINISQSIQNNADIQLSGHTHAGQFFPYNLILQSKFENVIGYKKIQGLHTIVTAGVSVGFWKIIGPWEMPYRIGTNSQIDIIDISFRK